MLFLCFLPLLAGPLRPGLGTSPPACPPMCECSSDAIIYCGRAGLRSLPRDIVASTISLNLSNNFLRTLPANAFGNLTFLTSLWLDRNNLTFLYPGAFKSLNNLRVLYLSRNSRLTYLHANTFQGLDNLTSLDLSHCNLFEIHPLVFSHLPSLEVLDLTANNMRYIPQAFQMLTSLMKLSLEENNIEAIGRDSLKAMRALQDLNLRKNRIWTIHHDAFLQLDQLCVLNLGHNHLSDLPRQLFRGLVQLKTVRLEANRFTKINCSFHGLRSLRKLYLNNNHIVVIASAAFSPLKELSFLHLNRNNLTHLSSRLFMELPKLRHVFLSHNPWECDCGMLWFAAWILTYQGVIEGLHCAIPVVHNRSLLGLLAQDPLASCSPPSGLIEVDACDGLHTNGASFPLSAAPKTLLFFLLTLQLCLLAAWSLHLTTRCSHELMLGTLVVCTRPI